MSLDDDFLLQDADDEKTIEFIKNYLPQDLKGKFTDDEFYYFLDVIADYYTTSGCLEQSPDKDGYVTIDQDAIVAYVVKEAKHDKIGDFDPEDILFVVQGEMEYGNSIGEVE
ncbi:MAG: hypothetical protein WCQ82_03045 [Bacteroidaceae bacterium]|nr:hypothetical protein [Bacteroidaceae bacterium]